MSEIRLHLADQAIHIESYLFQCSEDLGCEIERVQAGYLLLPEFMLRIFGVFVLPTEYGWVIAREEDATTWEDYVQTKIAHMLSEQFGGVLYYDDNPNPIPTAPERFVNFDRYVETALERESNVVKDAKRYWMYAHRKRTVR